MQLDPPAASPAGSPGLPSIRERLNRAALGLLLIPAAATAQEPAANQLDVTALLYGEQGRAQVWEPVVRASRLFGNGQSLAGQLTVDVISGASPSGALPSGEVQTSTSPSGNVTTIPAGAIPLTDFSDRRVALDGEWILPFGRFTTTTVGAHASHEKDYESAGVNGRLSFELMQKLLTLTIGGGINEDSVSPIGGTPDGLTDGTITYDRTNSKRSTTLLVGVSRVLTRRWLVGLDGTRTDESGYLTEPYKLISLMDPATGVPVGQLTDQRPTSRSRNSLLASSAYHFTRDILYSSYRYYWDSWDVQSHTLDFKYRHDLADDWYVEPHLRFYQQSAANFYVGGLVDGAPLPAFATADYRLGDLTTITAGATFAFHVYDSPSQWTVRAEYIRQAGDSSPPGVIGVQRGFDLAPPIDTISVVLGYSLPF